MLGTGCWPGCGPGSLIVDLASKPGGTDFAAAARRGHRAILALSLPGRLRAGDGGRGGGAHGADHAAGAGGEDTMITQNRGTIAFAVCGSFCTLEAALQSARALTAQGLAAAAGDEFCCPAGHPLWHGKLLEGAAGSRRRAPGTGHAAGGGAAGPPQNGAGTGGSPLHRGYAFPAGGGPVRHAGDAGGQEPAAGGLPGGAGRVHQRRAGGFRREHRRLFQRKHYYFVPYGQDDPAAKPQSRRRTLPGCLPRWKPPCTANSCSRCCWGKGNVQWLFSRGKMWYTKTGALPVRHDGQPNFRTEKTR